MGHWGVLTAGNGTGLRPAGLSDRDLPRYREKGDSYMTAYMVTTQVPFYDVEESWTEDPTGMRGPSSMPSTTGEGGWILLLAIVAFIAFRVWMTRRPEKGTWTPSKELEDLVRRKGPKG